MDKKNRTSPVMIVMLLASLAVSIGVTAAESKAPVFHVSPDGNDADAGSKAKPFRTLERARDGVRQWKTAHADRSETIIVNLMEGVYRRDKTLELNEQDSGTSDNPVIWRAYQGGKVTLLGGRQIPFSAVKPVTDQAILERIIDPSARAKVMQIDLRALGIDNYGELGPRGFRRAYIPAPLELFIDGKPLQVARWPNADEPQIPMGEVIDKGSEPRQGDYSFRPGIFEYGVERPKKWTQAKGFYVSGIFNYGWADDTIEVAQLDADKGTFTTTHPHIYGFVQRSLTKWYALNLLEEIDLPGEYFVDKQTGQLYFCPPRDFDQKSTLAVSMLEEPLIAIEGATGIELEGLTLEISRGSGIYIERGADNIVRGCTLRNLGIVAVQVGKGVESFPYGKHDACGNKEDGQPGQPVSRKLGSWHEHIYKFTAFNRDAGTGHRIIGCDIYDTGAGGVSLGGGDRRTLTPGNNAVINCDIYRVNRWDRTYKAPVNIDGVGNHIVNNHLHNCPGGGVYLHGNDHRIEYNEFDHLLTDMSDMGAIYMGRDPSETGNAIRNNFFHHIRNYHKGGRGVQAIYFDDNTVRGAEVSRNIFYRAGSNVVLKFNGGGGCDIIDNIFVDCPTPIWGSANSTAPAVKFMKSSLGRERLRERVDITKPPYSEKYPQLLAIYREEMPVLNKNVRPIITTASDPRFVDGENGDFALKPNAEVPPGFNRPDFDRIGLYIGDGRKTLPVELKRIDAETVRAARINYIEFEKISD